MLTLSGVGVTPADGDILRVIAYGSAVTQQKTDWAFVAEADGDLGSDSAKEYLG